MDELDRMMSLGAEEVVTEAAPEENTVLENVADSDVCNEEAVDAPEEAPSTNLTNDATADTVAPFTGEGDGEAANAEAPTTLTSEIVVDGNISKYPKDLLVSVSSVILNNLDKCIYTNVINGQIAPTNADADLTNYIVYINTSKNIPCVYDCTNLYFCKSDIYDANNNCLVTSIEGRRSGFVIKCVGHDIVMTKNFIYKCELDANGNITNVYEYSRMHKDMIVCEKLFTDITATDQFDAAIIYTQEFLKKVPKKLADKTIEGLRAEVKKQYSEVNDINAMINIIKLRVEIGC